MTDDLGIPGFLDRRAAPRGPHEATQCSKCGDAAEFGYNIEGAMQWFCDKHKISQNYADARLPKAEAQQTKQIARPLHVLVPLIKKELEQGRMAAHRAAMPYYLAAGKLPHEAKAQLPHGRFMPWVKETLSVTHRQATDYMALAEQEAKENGSTLPFSTITQFIRETRNPNYNKPFAPPPIDIGGMRERAEERRAESRLCLEIIGIGYKTLASKMHPDKGGSAEAMTRLNRARDRLKNFA